MRLAPSPSCDGCENQTASSWGSLHDHTHKTLPAKEPQKNHRNRRDDRREEEDYISDHCINEVLMTTQEGHDGQLGRLRDFEGGGNAPTLDRFHIRALAFRTDRMSH